MAEVDFDNDMAVSQAIRSGPAPGTTQGAYHIELPDGHYLAWMNHPLSGLTGTEWSEGVGAIRAQWEARVQWKQEDQRRARQAKKAALAATVEVNRDNTDAPIASDEQLLAKPEPTTTRASTAPVAAAVATTPAPAPGPSSPPAADLTPLQQAAEQLDRAAARMNRTLTELKEADERYEKACEVWRRWRAAVDAMEGLDD